MRVYLYDGINTQGNGGLNPAATFTSDPYELYDVLECAVTEERNGQFTLALKYPVGSAYWDKIQPDAIIMASPRPNAGEEPFRIFEVQHTVEGVVTAKANHLVYDLDGIIIGSPATAFSGVIGINGVLSTLTAQGNLSSTCFEVTTDGFASLIGIDITDNFVSVWKAIGRIADRYKAELKYTWASNRCTITFCKPRGKTSSAVISYGVNIVNLDHKIDNTQMYSRVVMAWFDDPSANPPYVQSGVNTGYTGRNRTLWIDVTSDYQTKPTTSTLGARAAVYVASHDWNPVPQLTATYVPLPDTTDYGVTNLAYIGTAVVGINVVGDEESVIGAGSLDLCDTATVDASLIGVSVTAKCVKVVFNVLSGRYDLVTIGAIPENIVDIIIRGS